MVIGRFFLIVEILSHFMTFNARDGKAGQLFWTKLLRTKTFENVQKKNLIWDQLVNHSSMNLRFNGTWIFDRVSKTDESQY